MDNYGLLIDGKIVHLEQTFPVINPATEEIIAQCPLADETALERAMKAAQRALPKWAATPFEDRQKLLIAIADVIQENLALLAKILVQEQGKPLKQALEEVGGAAYYTRYYASLELPVRVVDKNDRRTVEEHRKPLGIVAGIVPWNFPFIIAVYKLAPAILAGNVFILKPAPTTPLSVLKLGALIQHIVPKGVVQILSDNDNLGAAITSHDGIAKVTFTGSTATGKAIARSATGNLKRVTLELGGNDAAIVLPDVDLDIVVPKLYASAFANAGQVCVAIKRLYVHSDIYQELCTRMVELAQQQRVGNGLSEGVNMGPLQNKLQFEKLLSLIASAESGEGTVLCGGHRLGDSGYFIEPTIVGDAREGSELVDEEAFGPILPIMEFTEIDEVIGRANDSPYGLGGSVWSANAEHAAAIALRLDSGTVWINQHMVLSPDVPLRGAKQSGIGVENAVEGLHEYTSPQIINISKR